MTLVRTSDTGIIGMQRRLVEVGRIRAGEKVPSNGGRKRPAKRETWRLTSRDEQRLRAAAEIYGGEVQPWEDRDGEWELRTTSDTLDVAVVPGQAITQRYELWGQLHGKDHRGPNPVVCLRRCDGETELLSDKDCICAQEEEPACRPTTRLSVILTRVPGLGVWRVESHGKNAAVELAGGVELLEMLVASNRPIRARLRLDQRRQTVTIRNRSGIRTEERHFVVPVLDIDHTVDEVLAITGAAPAPTVAELEGAPGPSFTPVPELEPGPTPSIADQVGSVGEPSPQSKRANAAEPLKPTGRRPRRADEVSASPVASEESSGAADGGGESRSQEDGSVAPGSPPPPTDDEAPGGGMPRFQVVAMWCSDAGFDDDRRHAFLEAFSKVVEPSAPYSSSKAVPHEHMDALRRALDRIKAGEIAFVHDDPKAEPILVNTKTGEQIVKTGTPVPPAGAMEPWDAARWRAALKEVAGVGEAKLMKHARAVAQELGIDPPRDLGGIQDQLAVRCITWLREQQQ